MPALLTFPFKGRGLLTFIRECFVRSLSFQGLLSQPAARRQLASDSPHSLIITSKGKQRFFSFQWRKISRVKLRRIYLLFQASDTRPARFLFPRTVLTPRTAATQRKSFPLFSFSPAGFFLLRMAGKNRKVSGESTACRICTDGNKLRSAFCSFVSEADVPEKSV